MATKTNHTVVIAIDYGTAYSGYAYCLRTKDRDQQIHTNKKWKSTEHQLESWKTPTCILLKKDKSFHSFGYDAEDMYTDLTQAKKEQNLWYYFHGIKMKLYENKTLTRDTIVKDISGKPMDAISVIAMSIKYLKDHAVKNINNTLTKDLKDDDVLYVVTVPAIWDDPAKQFMREASEKAGIETHNLMLCLEPEAASLHCQTVPTEKLEGGEHFVVSGTGTQYMVIDLGGGTVDITVHERQEDGKLKEIHQATGGPWGGGQINRKILQRIEDYVGKDLMTTYRNQEPYDYVGLMREIENKKRSVKSNPDKDTIILQNAYSLWKLFQEKQQQSGGETENRPLEEDENEEQAQPDAKPSVPVDESYVDGLCLYNAKLYIKYHVFIDIFKIAAGDIINHVQGILGSMESLSLLLMVGSFSESSIVQESFRKHFGPKHKIVCPEESGLAVLRGAVRYGLDPKAISSRILRFTYGIGITKEFDKDVHQKDKKKVIAGKEYCSDVFSVLASQGDSVESGFEVKKTFTPIKPTTTTMVHEIYFSTDKNPRHVTDPSSRYLGSFKVTLKPSTKQEKRKYEQVATFGETEIKFEAREPEGDHLVSAVLSFRG